MKNRTLLVQLQQIAPDFDFHPFGNLLRRPIEDALKELGKSSFRKGTILTPVFLIWIVLAMTLRRDLNLNAVIDWMFSGTQWINLNLAVKKVSDGAVTHARVALGFEVFQRIFKAFSITQTPKPDFHGLTTMIFDGTTMTMPDTEKNCAEFDKRSSQYNQAGFPQLRMVALMVGANHQVLDLAYAACRGKGTGETTLMREIFDRLILKCWFLLFDAGFYSFQLAWTIQQRNERFIFKVKKNFKPVRIKGSEYSDGSYLALITGKVDGQMRQMVVRVIDSQLRGFLPFRLITNLLDEKISAREIVIHYHQRWEIEIAFDEIKTHQCACLRGQSPTILRSKRPDLVKQELYALLISYNAVRVLMMQAAQRQGIKPVKLSFLHCLQAIIDALPLLNWKEHPHCISERINYLLDVLAESEIEFARRPRINPRVIKVKVSKFKRKDSSHQGEKRDFDKDLSIIAPINISLGEEVLPQAA